MRELFAYDAVLSMAPDEDEGAPGAAITTALCGSWQHEPPCPMAPHHTDVHRVGEQVRVRVLYAVDRDQAPSITALVERTLARGVAPRPDGSPSAWRLRSGSPSLPRSDEAEHGRRLTSG